MRQAEQHQQHTQDPENDLKLHWWNVLLSEARVIKAAAGQKKVRPTWNKRSSSGIRFLSTRNRMT